MSFPRSRVQRPTWTRTQVSTSRVGRRVVLTAVLCPQQENIMKSNIDKKFSAHYDAVEAELKSSTVGE